MGPTRGDGSAGSGDMVFRLAREDDLLPVVRVFRAAVDDFLARHGLPGVGGADDARVPLYRHILRHDGPRFWVAERDGAVVGFTAAIVRGTWWYYSALFVLPEAQGRGVGRSLFELAKAGYPLPGGVAVTITDAVQPSSNTLYARCGLLPRIPVICFSGRPSVPPGWTASQRGDLEPISVGTLAELREIEAAVTGIDRTVDHGYLLSLGEVRRGWLLRRAGRPVGYVFVDTRGMIGPVASLRPADMTVLMGHGLGTLAKHGTESVSVAVPGPNVGAQRVLWEAGLVFENPSGLLLMSRPFGRFDRYVVGSYGLM